MGMLGIHVGVSTGLGMAKQAAANETDINKIVAGFERTGMVTHLNDKQPFYGDVSDIAGYQAALDIVQKADELFMGMDARVRERFHNDPVEMISFLQNPANVDEAVKLGMVVKQPEAVVDVAPVAPVVSPVEVPVVSP